MAKVFRRLVPFCVLIYILAYIDRINVGVAALTMNADLHLSALAFGTAATVFYLMYSVFEVPSNIAMARVGARVWIPRIMITWGLATVATVFAKGAVSLIIFRGVLGAAEAGLFPGIIFLFGGWFPRAYRARANALFLTSQPLALLIGAPLSGLLLLLDGHGGLRGWQWLFLLEGIPPILIGVAVYYFLPNGPKDARWLDAEEQQLLEERLTSERTLPPDKSDIWIELRNPAIIALGLVYFCIAATLSTFSVWTPLIVKDVLGAHSSPIVVAIVSAIPPLFAFPIMRWASVRSDRSGNRFGLLAGLMLVSGLGWIVLVLAPFPAAKLFGLSLCFGSVYGALAIFWAAVPQAVPSHRPAVVIGIVSTIGSLAAIVGPSVIGYLRDVTHSFNASAWYGAGLLLAGTGLIAMIAKRSRLASA